MLKPSPHPWSMEKLSSMKPVPGAKKAGDHCLNPCDWLPLESPLEDCTPTEHGVKSVAGFPGE